MSKYFYLILIILLSTVWLYSLHFFAPELTENKNAKAQLKYPANLDELQKVAAIFKLYSKNHWWYSLLMFASAYIYKQAFCIPGSLLLNLLAGALYGKIGGLFLACLLTVIGATVCYSLSSTFAKELVIAYFPEISTTFLGKVRENKENLLHFMLFIRIFPVTPGWVINIVAPLAEIPLHVFLISTFIGLGPYNFIGVAAGETLSSLKSIEDVFTWNMFFSVTIIALVAAGPAIIMKYRSRLQNINPKLMNLLKKKSR